MKANNVQRGFSLISAIFLLVVMAGLGAAMVTFSTSQSQNLAMDVLGSRAYQAAHAGVEWAAYNIALNDASSNPVPTVIPLAGNLADFTVTVSFNAVAHSDVAAAGGPVVSIWTHDIAASAVYGTPGTLNYVERVVNAKL